LEDYNLPEGFHWATYMDRNEDLRKSGVCAQDSAKSHWTRYGSQESRPY
jgi:hypothetical protein